MPETSSTAPALASIAGCLVVSCQATDDSPLRHTPTIARLAASALKGGAAGLRINGVQDIAAIRELTRVPIIGLDKQRGPRRSIITETNAQLLALAAAGADIVAIEATFELFEDVAARVRSARELSPVPVMADISTLEEGLAAWDAGADIVGTTLSGYTRYSRTGEAPDIELVEALAGRGIRVIAEGRYRTPAEVASALDSGAFAVVVGGAITDPISITRRFIAATARAR